MRLCLSLRGYSDDQNLQVWLEQKMWPMEGKYIDQDTRAGSALAIVEMLKTGTTAFVDMYDRMDQVAAMVEQSGIRGCLTRGVIGLCSEEIQQAKLTEAIAFARDWNGKADGRITTMISPHAPYTCPPDYIEKFVQAAMIMICRFIPICPRHLPKWSKMYGITVLVLSSIWISWAFLAAGTCCSCGSFE